MRKMFNAITVEDVIEIRGEKIFKHGKELSEMSRNELRDNAKYMLQIPVWDEVQKRIRLAANNRMYNQSKDFDDMLFGKAVLYVSDVYDNILKNLSKLK